MNWLIMVRNVKTGATDVLQTFFQIEFGSLIGWRSDDGGETTAVWEVYRCLPVAGVKEV